MTAKARGDDVTDTRSSKSREAWGGQGVANVVTGCFGGMGGCAMIGQTMINVKASGARTRISTFLAGVFLLILVVVLGDIVSLISMAALVAVMISVSVATFGGHSIRPATLKALPKSETMVMFSTVIGVVTTHNLAIGVGVGVLVAMVLFARRVAHFVTVERTVAEVRRTAGHVPGEWGALLRLLERAVHPFEYALDPEQVVIDLHASHLWDPSTIASLDAITEKYRKPAKLVRIVGLNNASVQMRERLAGRLGPSGHPAPVASGIPHLCRVPPACPAEPPVISARGFKAGEIPQRTGPTAGASWPCRRARASPTRRCARPWSRHRWCRRPSFLNDSGPVPCRGPVQPVVVLQPVEDHARFHGRVVVALLLRELEERAGGEPGRVLDRVEVGLE